jgi:hypothetical protein
LKETGRGVFTPPFPVFQHWATRRAEHLCEQEIGLSWGFFGSLCYRSGGCFFFRYADLFKKNYMIFI